MKSLEVSGFFFTDNMMYTITIPKYKQDVKHDADK